MRICEKELPSPLLLTGAPTEDGTTSGVPRRPRTETGEESEYLVFGERPPLKGARSPLRQALEPKMALSPPFRLSKEDRFISRQQALDQMSLKRSGMRSIFALFNAIFPLPMCFSQRGVLLLQLPTSVQPVVGQVEYQKSTR